MRPMTTSLAAVLLATAPLLCLALLLCAPAAMGAEPISGPLRASAVNPRYFTDDTGKAVYLTGSHTWNVWQNLSGLNEPNPPPGTPGKPASVAAYLDVLQANNHNFVRLWVADTAWSPVTNTSIEPQPYVRTGPGNAADGRPRFDLTQLNQAYFDALRACVIAARERGIYVSVMLFDSWGISEYKNSYPANITWNYHPFRSANNINGVNGDSNNDGIGAEYHTWQIPAIRTLQEAYIRKVVDTVYDLDNVLYEVANETGNYSTAWQYAVIDLIKSHEATRTARVHPVGMTFQYSDLGSGTNANLFNSPADWVSPAGTSGSSNYLSNPPAAAGPQVSIVDTDHIDPYSTDPTWVWKSFLRGHNPIVMDWWNGSAWEAIRRAMGHTRSFAQRMNLAAMTPQNALASTAYCLAAPGAEYLAYQPGSGAFNVNLVAGTYAVEWCNVSSGATTTSGAITVAAGNRSFTPPFSGQAVLYLKERGLA